jgi:hypothetical protein
MAKHAIGGDEIQVLIHRLICLLIGWWLRRRVLLGSSLRPWEIPFLHLSAYSREIWIAPTALKEILKSFSSFVPRVVFI